MHDVRAKDRHKHELYEQSVQNPDFEVHFIRRIFRKHRGRNPRRLREDFCGTGYLCAEWVQKVRDGRARGVDLDGETLAWGRRHHLDPLPEKARRRVELVQSDVLETSGFRADLVCAFNFSWFAITRRDLLLRYFRRVRESLVSDGIFLLDIYGGPEAQILQEESTDHGGFDYVWDQAQFNPITHEYICRIHFDFPDGTRRRAFSYRWRLWSLPETLDVLRDAGFQEPVVYWEGTARNGTGNGVFRPSRKGDDSAAWIAYIVAPR